ncbi:hypothetical protein KY343_05035 [Candidatus Woesearchaeota archaeon]|nr:hypothetical protein [Candidatus Woesearchaeota archaeon]
MFKKTIHKDILLITLSVCAILLFAMYVQVKVRPTITGIAVGGYIGPRPPSCTLKNIEYIWEPEECSPGITRKKTALLEWFPPWPACQPASREVGYEICPETPAEGEGAPSEISVSVDGPNEIYSGLQSESGYSATITNTGTNSISFFASMETPLLPSTDIAFTTRIGENWGTGMSGLTAHSVLGSRLLQWNTTPTQHYDKLDPGEMIQINFTIFTPITNATEKELHLIIRSDEEVIYDKAINNIIDFPQFFVIPDIREDNILDVYMIIYNTKDEDKRYNIEFNIGQESSKPTLIEYFGPYTIKANDIKIVAYKYEYNEDIAGSDYVLKAVLYEKDRKVAESLYDLNLINKITAPLLEKPILFDPPKKNYFASLLGLILVVILSVAFISTYKYQIKKEVEEIKKMPHSHILDPFFDETLRRGHTFREIKEILVKKGWPKKTVQEHYKKYIKKKKQ